MFIDPTDFIFKFEPALSYKLEVSLFSYHYYVSDENVSREAGKSFHRA